MYKSRIISVKDLRVIARLELIEAWLESLKQQKKRRK